MKLDKTMLPIWSSKLKELNDRLNAYQASLDRMYRIKTPRYSYDENDFSLRALYGRMFDLYIEWRKKNIKKCETQIRKFMWFQAKCKGKEMRGGLDIDHAKAYPITELMPSQPTGKSGGRIYYKCPIVEEKTASFVIYKEQNTFHCFSCNKGSSVIDLFMELNHCTFVEAVKSLQSY